MFRISDKEIKQLEGDLKAFAHRALPFATKNTLNTAAFQARTLIQRDIDVKLISRNRFTKQSIRVEQARTLVIPRQAAIVGSIAPYMEDQEFGAVKVSKGKQGVPIATSYAAGQGQDVQPRTRLPRKANTMATIQLRRRRRKGSSRKQRNLIAIKDAATTGRKYVFLDLGRRQGIFKVTGSKRLPKIKMVWDMTRRSVVIPKNPIIKPAFDTVVQRIPTIYRDSIIFQLKRQGLFKG